MRVPADKLGCERIGNIGKCEIAFLPPYFGMEQDLEQQIPKLLGVACRIFGVNGVKDLVGLLDKVLPESIEGLFAIPRASVPSAEPADNPQQLVEAVPAFLALWAAHFFSAMRFVVRIAQNSLPHMEQ
jgi:hypothetical protein